ncbi:MAG: chromosomal replication initiator protein DnaA [Bacteroidaceae bacterium]|nr:chromosomal replication initiator protein DnaA [Bacteroidaceae bacterium]
MEQPGTDRWTACLDILRGSLPPKTFDTWIAPLRFVSLKGKDLTVAAPNKYVHDFIEEHCINQLRRALIDAFGPGVRLLYSIPKDTDPAPKSNLLDLAPAEEKPRVKFNPNLNRNYSFENFVEGASNKLALTVARAIARNPDQVTFNPFFIFGPSGIGKTHLANAIGMALHQDFPDKRVLFVPVHLFQAQYTEAVRNGRFNDFMGFYQSIDVLIIDDIQELSTPKTQQAFFHIFNHLHQNQRHIVITSDRPPAQLSGLEERMLTRFKWGMLAEIDRPDMQLRKDILRAKTYRDGLTLDDEVLDFIAHNVTGSVRELEGVVNSLMAFSITLGGEIDCTLAASIISKTVNAPSQIEIADVIAVVARHQGVSRRDMTSKSRKQPVVAARHMAMYLLKKHLGLRYQEIGEVFGGRDHSTVLHALRQAENRMVQDSEWRKSVEDVEAKLTAAG